MEKQKEIPHYQFLPKLKNAKSFPIYFIYGTENYLMDSVLKAIIDKFKTEGTEEFDLNIFYGDDCSIVSVLEQLEMPPFMAKYQIVILKNYDKLKLKDKNLIADYSTNPAETSLLILTAESNDQRLSANKKINKEAIRITCKPPYRTDNIIGFLKNEIKKKKQTKPNMNKKSIYQGLKVSECIKILRTLKPMDIKPVIESVKKTHRLLVIYEGCITGGVGGEIIAQIGESEAFLQLDAPLFRLGGLNLPIPYNLTLEKKSTPQIEDIVSKVKHVVKGVWYA